jgi:hypothetical protein
MDKQMTENRYEKRDKFRKHMNLEDDFKYFTRMGELWRLFGNNGAKHRPSGHYFIQEIIEHNFVDWHGWKSKLHHDLKDIIKNEFPQLMVTFKKYANG